jgi:hypothetical protein
LSRPEGTLLQAPPSQLWAPLLPLAPELEPEPDPELLDVDPDPDPELLDVDPDPDPNPELDAAPELEPNPELDPWPV